MLNDYLFFCKTYNKTEYAQITFNLNVFVILTRLATVVQYRFVVYDTLATMVFLWFFVTSGTTLVCTRATTDKTVERKAFKNEQIAGRQYKSETNDC